MKIKYEFLTGEIVEVEVPDNFGEFVIGIERDLYNSNQTEKRRHRSYDYLSEQGMTDVFNAYTIWCHGKNIKAQSKSKVKMFATNTDEIYYFKADYKLGVNARFAGLDLNGESNYKPIGLNYVSVYVRGLRK